ncbi:MAG: YicC/YloC family endoribonuclease, partial [Pseudomonadota bacterium]
EVALDLAPLHQAALALMDDALDQLVAHREREGERLAGMLEERLAKVAHEVAGVRARSADVNQLLLGRMRERVAALDTSVDDGRLEQEVALLAQKADVAEELDRLDSHVTEGREALTRDEPVGRRLDFLMQEFNREANTLASKSHDAESTRASVELKVLIEQMREQVQNVE